jgi:hypothetical protein
VSEPPQVVILQTGRWIRHIHIEHDLKRIAPAAFGVQTDWLGFGERHARWRARRILARYQRDEARRTERANRKEILS